MLIYNVTIKTTWAIYEDWVRWMQQEHIPDIMATGCFEKFQFTRVLDTDEEDGPTFATQYYAPSQEAYENYITYYSQEMRKKSLDKWGNSFIAFRSLMEIIA
jgi:hypothetical protein